MPRPARGNAKSLVKSIIFRVLVVARFLLNVICPEPKLYIIKLKLIDNGKAPGGELRFCSVWLDPLKGCTMLEKNNVKKIREAKMLSKSELAKLAGVSPLTIDRIEKGMQCRLATQRKILLAFGLKLSEKTKVFR